MQRRKFIALVGGGAAAWPLAGRAQQQRKVWRIGFVAGAARPVPLDSGPYSGFVQGMRELAYVEGRDYVIEWRFAEGRYELFTEFAAEFARLRVDIIVTALSQAVLPMLRANPDTPIVLGYSTDPVALGFAVSLARPGGNVTGLANSLDEIMAKQVDLLVTMVPKLNRVALLTNSTNSANAVVLKSVQAAVRQARVSLVPVEARNVQDIGSVFELVKSEHVDAIIVAADSFFFSQRQRIAEFVLAQRLPSIFANSEYVEAGGLMSYGDSIREFYRRAAAFVDKIFKGAKPSDLPIEQPTKFHLVINRKTADALGLTIPASLYVFANEVIE
jgi:putative tryptophan/tyrosine transport system substrate-binding protein